MAVFRIEKTRDYTVMSNHHLRDTELSLKAKGLLSLMLSLPENWDYTTKGLAHICKDGVDSISAGIRELEEHGYVIRERVRNPNGQLGSIEYTILEQPRPPEQRKPKQENPVQAIPGQAPSGQGKPEQGECPQLNKDISSNYLSNTDLSSTDESNPIESNPPTPTGTRMGSDRMGAREIYREIILENIEYDTLCQNPQIDRGQLDEILELIVDTVCTARDTIRISRDDFPAEVVKSRFLKLDASHVQYVMDCMKENTTYIRNIKKYLLTALYNAPTLSGVSATTVTAACQKKRIALTTAEAIAKAIGKDVAELFEIEEGKAQLSNKTILEHHRLIHTILTQAEKEMLVQYNAAAKATPPKATKKEVNYFQPEDIVKIREALDKEPLKWKVATHLLLITGCRRGEIMGLRWDRVDFANSKIKIDTNLLYSAKRGIYEDTTKTGTVRFIKLPSETMELLRQYRRWYMELKIKNGDRWQDTGFLFVKENGEPMIPDGITAWLSEFSKRHDLPHINPHAFRHTMASILINSGKDVVSVSKRLGHAKVSTTTDIYSHIIMEADEQASECLADVMLRPTKKRAAV